MDWLPRILNSHKLEKVFTPSTVAKLTYIQRVKVEDDVVKYLNLPGMQLALYGHSGCGKTTLVINVLRRLKMKYITTRCKSDTTFEDLLLQAFDKLGIYYGTETTSKVSRSIKGGLAATRYKEIAADINVTKTVEQGTKAVRALPLQLTPQRLAEFLGELNCVWIIEDFHKVDSVEKVNISDVLKIFIDTSEEYPNTKVICIGAVDTARELIECDSNLNNRIAEIYVPLMTLDELTQIAEKGFKMMNASIPEQIIIKIVYYSNKLASVCHQICYDICYSKNIKSTLLYKQKVNMQDFKEAVSSYVRKNTDTFSKIFDHAVASRPRRLALEAMINLDKEYLTIDEIYKEVRKIEEIQKNIFIFAIDELTTVECFEVVRYDQNSKKYSFSTPLFQAFVKMKLALEDLEEIQRMNRKKKRYSLNDGGEERVYDEKFLEHYFRELDRYYLRNIHEVERLKGIINELKNK